MTRKEKLEQLNNHPLFQMSDEKRKEVLEKDVDNKYRDEILLLVYYLDGSKLDSKIYYDDIDDDQDYDEAIDSAIKFIGTKGIKKHGSLMADNTFLPEYDNVAALEAVTRALKYFSSTKGAKFYTYYRSVYDNVWIDYYLKEEPIRISRTVYKLICDARSLHASMNCNYYTEEEAVERMKEEPNYMRPIEEEFLEHMKGDVAYTCLSEQDILDIMRDDPQYKKHTEETFKQVEKYMKSGGVLVVSDHINSLDGDEEISLIDNIEDEKQKEQLDNLFNDKSQTIKAGMEELFKRYLSLTRANHRAILALDATKNIMKELKTDDGKEFYDKEPAGNKEIYTIMSQDDSDFMRKMFKYDYARSTVEPEPESTENLYGIYYNMVLKGVEYTDKEVAEFIDVKPSSYSRSLKTINEKLGKMTYED